MAEVALVLGGVRSGKSDFAEQLALAACASPVLVATAMIDPEDPEMMARIARHQARRTDVWRLVEEPVELAGAVLNYGVRGGVCLVDCMTLWLAHIMSAGLDVDAEVGQVIQALAGCGGKVVLVSNEPGLGGVAMDPLTRRFVDAHGRMNQKLAAVADQVVLVVAGLPVHLKGA